MTTTALLKLAGELEAAREAARLLFGERYAELVEPWRAFVRERCAAWGCRPLMVVPNLIREGADPDQDIALALVAASVDVAEEGL